MKAKLNTFFKVFLTVLCVLYFTVNDSGAQCDRQPLQEALDAMLGDTEVSVTTMDNETNGFGWTDPDYYYEFTPTSSTPSEALIIYTGGLVLPSPSCLAILEKERADVIIEAHSEIEKWSIGGHSFGGVVAAMYIDGSYTHSDKNLLLKVPTSQKITFSLNVPRHI